MTTPLPRDATAPLLGRHLVLVELLKEHVEVLLELLAAQLEVERLEERLELLDLQRARPVLPRSRCNVRHESSHFRTSKEALCEQLGCCRTRDLWMRGTLSNFSNISLACASSPAFMMLSSSASMSAESCLIASGGSESLSKSGRSSNDDWLNGFAGGAALVAAAAAAAGFCTTASAVSVAACTAVFSAGFGGGGSAGLAAGAEPPPAGGASLLAPQPMDVPLEALRAPTRIG